MKKTFWLLPPVFVLGCTIQTSTLSIAPSATQIQVVKQITISEHGLMGSGNVLFVNRQAGVCKDVLVFDGHHNIHEIIVREYGDLPAIDLYNIGRFSIAPASGGKQRAYGEALVGPFRRNQEYTLLITTQMVSDDCRSVVCEPQICYCRNDEKPLGEKYRHPAGESTVEEMVNNVVYLPDANVPTQPKDARRMSNFSIDALLGRGLTRSVPENGAIPRLQFPDLGK